MSLALLFFFCIYYFSTPEFFFFFFKGSASPAKHNICTHCATSHHSSASPFVPGTIFPVKISKESLLFTPAPLIFHQWTWWYQLNTWNFTSAEILTPGKWSLVWGGNCSAQGIQQMPNPAVNQVFPALFYIRQKSPTWSQPNPAAGGQQAGTAALETAPVRAPCFGFSI